ncbi:MAG: 6-bladed beta-propeller [Magnetococcales bacterium]|nr:6-bladed beta-propeller [Magnetococcales bacterium]HIJ83338.1 6-bladed beta-propeller [Magnetococcales bacterium]
MCIKWLKRYCAKTCGGIIFLLLSACVTVTPQENEPETSEIYWPRPPELPRYVWESVIHGVKDIQLNKKDQGKALSFLFPETDEDKPVFIKPVRIAAQGGRIFVTDTMARAIHVFDAGRRRYYQFGFRREGAVDKPLGIALDQKGLIYVADSKKKSIIVYDQLGLWVKLIGDEKTLTNPVAVGVSPTGDRVYALDNGGPSSQAHRMVIFDQEGKQQDAPVGRRGQNDGEFNYPTDISVGTDGRVYVLDSGNFRIQVFDRDGRFLKKWGKIGQGLGQFARPRAIAVDKDNLVYVLDGAFANLQVFNDQGQLLLPIGERSKADGPGTFAAPSGVATDETGRVYVIDQWLKKVEILRKLSETEGQKILDGKPHLQP